ncbi:hypothetical protein MM221_20165 [Salipaludibacillus sp. LMS25]|uniref:hypothetical protein n=1 Tax=Salipaludibacillus sp. LMS25 TaxID=2924031 RepID=UPI0020D01B64|nr:hypothetical protein [Salipaludibacillus sp. LMS25]UTR14830.1 hypothetical protein MM221_20165 [Salipaludibacillus sp. LMS25]
MKSLNEEIMEIKEELRKKEKWSHHVERLKDQIHIKEQKVSQLAQSLADEKEDVEKLHRFSVDNIFSTLVGNKQEKLQKREQEVITAKLNYQDAKQKLQELKKEYSDYSNRLKGVINAGKDYEDLLDRKEILIQDEMSIWSEELFRITEKEADLSNVLVEYEEAIAAGEKALITLKEAAVSFDKAKNWSKVDMIGGGFITTAIKHNHVDDAKDRIHDAEVQLRHFEEELLDIQNQLNIELSIGDMLTFADYFFDGLIVDWLVHDKISQAADQIDKTISLVAKTLTSLREDSKRYAKKLQELSVKRIEIIEHA